MIDKIRKLYQSHFYGNFVASLFLAAIGITISIYIISIYYFPINIFLIPLIKIIINFTITPILKHIGIISYHSPLLFTTKLSENKWEIHNGTTFDYFLNFKWSNKGNFARKFTIKSYLTGLLEIIKEVKKADNPKKIEILGTTYFLGKNTISKIGFKKDNVRFYRKFMFILDYLNLMIMLSFSKGQIAFPNIFNLSKVKITGENLINSEKKIMEYLNFLSNKEFGVCD